MIREIVGGIKKLVAGKPKPKEVFKNVGVPKIAEIELAHKTMRRLSPWASCRRVLTPKQKRMRRRAEIAYASRRSQRSPA